MMTDPEPGRRGSEPDPSGTDRTVRNRSDGADTPRTARTPPDRGVAPVRGVTKKYSLYERDKHGGRLDGGLPRQRVLVQGYFEQGCECGTVRSVNVGKRAFRGNPFVFDA